jgi:hypothetical protein
MYFEDAKMPSNKKASHRCGIISGRSSSHATQANKRKPSSKMIPLKDNLNLLDDIEAYFSTPLPSQTKRLCPINAEP